MSIRRFALAVAIAAFALAAVSTDAMAQKTGTSKKLYRWVDKDGNVRYTDQLPPEAAKDRRDELNSQGIVVKTRERELTPEEKAAKRAEEARLAEEKARQDELKKRDAMLVGAYATEADLKRAYKERFSLVDQSIESAKVGICSQQKSQEDLLNYGKNLELEGKANKRAMDEIFQKTQESRRQVQEQRAFLERREAERAELQKEYIATLARYRELMGIESDPNEPVAFPAAPSTDDPCATVGAKAQ
jgi:hypothetical protein